MEVSRSTMEFKALASRNPSPNHGPSPIGVPNRLLRQQHANLRARLLDFTMCLLRAAAPLASIPETPHICTKRASRAEKRHAF